MTITPLNPALYAALQARFGDVRISNAGQQRIVRYEPDPRRPGRLRAVAQVRGEQYVVCCPFCGDTRRRLYASYQYGLHDPQTGSSNFGLWFCQHERCHEDAGNRHAFRMMTRLPFGREARLRRQQPASAACTELPASQAIVLPDGLIPIGALPAAHPAVAYLIDRGFDPQALASVWGVEFCDSCVNVSPPATNRLVFPIFRPVPMSADSTSGRLEWSLAGWQARLVPGIELLGGSDAKYLSAAGMRKSELLYGLPQALQTTGPVCVVEGPTDVWRIGPGAVALLGKDLAETQKLLLAHHFAGRPVVVMLDQDAPAAAEEVRRKLQLARISTLGDNRVVVAELPPGREDPAACSPAELLQAVDRALGGPLGAPPFGFGPGTSASPPRRAR